MNSHVSEHTSMQCYLGKSRSWGSEFQKVFVSCDVSIKDCLSAFFTTASTTVRQASSEVFEFLNPEIKCWIIGYHLCSLRFCIWIQFWQWLISQHASLSIVFLWWQEQTVRKCSTRATHNTRQHTFLIGMGVPIQETLVFGPITASIKSEDYNLWQVLSRHVNMLLTAAQESCTIWRALD